MRDAVRPMGPLRDGVGNRAAHAVGGTTTEFLSGAGGLALEKQGGSDTQARWLSLSKPQANGLLRRGSEVPLFDGPGSGTSPDQTDWPGPPYGVIRAAGAAGAGGVPGRGRQCAEAPCGTCRP